MLHWTISSEMPSLSVRLSGLRTELCSIEEVTALIPGLMKPFVMMLIDSVMFDVRVTNLGSHFSYPPKSSQASACS